MPVSSYSGLRGVIRNAIRDTHGLLWDDAALDRLINEAQREYSLLSESLTGKVEIVSGSDPVNSLPDNFISPVKFIGTDNREKPFYSWRYLHDQYPDFRKITGTELRGVVTDFDGFGKIRLFPRLPVGRIAGTLYYQRTPVKNQIETDNTEAIRLYSLFYVFMHSGNRAAGDYYERFRAAVNAESTTRRSVTSRSPYRRGRFF